MIIGNRNDQKRKPTRQREGYQGKVNLYNFVIFKNYDGSVTSRTMPRDLYNKLFSEELSKPQRLV